MSACPRCSTPLTEVHRDTVHLAVCTACGGVWMGGTTLRRFVSALKRRPEAVEAAVAAADGALFVFEPDPDELSCPQCERAMEITRHPSGVTLDLCRLHGVWFDRDELTRVVEAPEGASVADAAQERLKAPAPAPASSVGTDLAAEALVGTLEVADVVGTSGVDAEQLAGAAGASIELAGGALEMLGGLAGGALELVFDALGSIDLS